MHVSEEENPELLWGLRGGGGNFGIATSLEYRLHPIGPMLLAGPIFFAGDRAEEVLRFYRDWVRELPDELTTLAGLMTAPPAPFLPEAVHGKPIVAVIAVHAGEPERGRALVQPLKDLGDPIVDLIGVMPYTAMQSLLDALWDPWRAQLHALRLRRRARSTRQSRRSSASTKRCPRRTPRSTFTTSAGRWRASATTMRRSVTARRSTCST